MKVSDHIANLLSKKTSIVFGGQGSSVIHLIDSIKRHKKLQFIPGQSEQGSSLAADAYFRVSGKIGVTLGTSGPGILNFLQGMACSYFDSIPSLYIAGAPVISHLRKNKFIRQIGFQEMEVQKMVKPITKYSSLILKLDQIDYEFDKAIDIAFNGRMGPVLIELPDDIQRSSIPTKKKIYYPIVKKKTNNKDLKIKRVLKLLKESKKPLLLLGNGIRLSNTTGIIKKFIKKYQIPYACSWGAADLFKSNDKLNAGSFGVAATRYGNFALQKADLILCIGIRFGTQIVGGDPKKFSPKSKKILVDIDSNEFKSQRLPNIDVKINSEISDFILALSAKKINLNNNDIKNWTKIINKLKISFPVLSAKNYKNSKYVDPYYFFKNLSFAIKNNSTFIPDASANLIWTYQAFEFIKNVNTFTAFNHSPMGYSLAASVGAFFGDRSKVITSIIGDGSVPMNVQELETIKNYNVNVKIFVINNKGYSLIKQTQETWLNSRYAGVDKSSGLSLPDNCKIAKSYGVKSMIIWNNKDLNKKLKKIYQTKGPILIDVRVDPTSRVAPKIDYGKPLHDMSPALPRDTINKILEE